jgi:hypothetical protein
MSYLEVAACEDFMRFQGRGAEGSYERLFLAERVGLDRTYEPWFWFFDLYVSVRVLLYMVVINVHMSMRTIHVAKQKVVWKSDPCVLEPVPSYPAGRSATTVAWREGYPTLP